MGQSGLDLDLDLNATHADLALQVWLNYPPAWHANGTGASTSTAAAVASGILKSTCTTAGLAILYGFSFHCFSQSSNDGTVTSACFE